MLRGTAACAVLFGIAKRLDKSLSSTKFRYLLAPNNSSQNEFCIN